MSEKQGMKGLVPMFLVLIGLAAGVRAQLAGTIKIDGSSTVFPISEAVAEEFQKENKGVKVLVGISGTGGGFKKFCPGETDINDASRAIKASEVTSAIEHGTKYIELPVAIDGLSVLINPENTWAEKMTMAELKKIWMPGSTVKKWSDVRADWPARPIRLYGPGTDSGTFDYFTERVNGKEKASRSDYTASEDDNVLVQGVAGDKDALGYFGYAYYMENKDKLKVVAVDGVLPSSDSIMTFKYPISRPIFIYVNPKAAQRAEVQAFVNFYLDSGSELVPQVGYIPLSPKEYGMVKARFADRTTGSVFNKPSAKGKSVDVVLGGAK